MHGGEDPYRLYNDRRQGLGPPKYPRRVKHFMYGCAEVAHQLWLTAHDLKVKPKRGASGPQKPPPRTTEMRLPGGGIGTKTVG